MVYDANALRIRAINDKNFGTMAYPDANNN